MVQFCNVNSCQSFIFKNKEHFLTSNELGNWPQIWSDLSVLVKNKVKPSNQPQTNRARNGTIKLEYKLYNDIILLTWLWKDQTPPSPQKKQNFLHVISIFIKGSGYVIFFFTDMKKEARRQSWEKQMPPTGQRCHLVVLVFVPATLTPVNDVQFQLDYTVFLAVKTRTMDPTPPAASAFSCHCNSTALLLSDGLSKPL